MKTINIRNVGRDDLEHLLELNQSNLPHVGSISMPELAHLHSQAVYFRVAEFQRQTAGFLIVVVPEARRQGIAVGLYQDLEHFAAERKIPIMACEYNLRPKNEVSRQFHRRYGFKEVGTQDTENGKKTVSLQIKPVEPVATSIS